MGLVKRNNIWWMSFTFKGARRRSTETSTKSWPKLLSKVRVQIVEGKYFEKPKEDPYTFSQLMDRYLKEHASRRAHYRRYVNMATNVKTSSAIQNCPRLRRRPSWLKAKRYADGVMLAPLSRTGHAEESLQPGLSRMGMGQDNPVCRVSMEKEQNSRDRWLTEQEEARLPMAAPAWI